MVVSRRVDVIQSSAIVPRTWIEVILPAYQLHPQQLSILQRNPLLSDEASKQDGAGPLKPKFLKRATKVL